MSNGVDDALALAAQKWAAGEVQLSPWGITQAALSLINKEHALHVRSWDVAKDGDFAEALARAIRSSLEGYAMVSPDDERS
jgi:hypothetical protein